MKQILTFFILFFSLLSFSQEKKQERIYEFDYFLEYSSVGGEILQDSIKHFKVINSKDNSYSITLSDIGNDSLALNFNHYIDIYASGKILKKDFIKPDTLDFKCGYKKHIRDNLFTKSRKKSYNFKLNYHKLKDTIINGKSCVKYAVLSERKLKKEKLKTKKFLIIEKNEEFEKPNIDGYFNLEQWNKSDIKIKGIVAYKFHRMKSSKLKLKNFESNLVSYSRFKKVLKINLDCD